ncbi:6-bladed beta-propeller [Candidatus Palauibacter sp.]|uniref:6-bladed beta-propeller n=1 Tax=Candidatus Palauibacter sp. TaxID=3101350 RepID=UPI003B5168CF
MARPDTFGGCVVTSTGSRLLAALLVFPLVSCGSSDGSVTTASPARYALNELGSFGWGSLADSSRRLTDQELRYGGAVLSAIVGFDVDHQGRIFVHDADYEKIVVFSPSGHLERLIAAGSGEGPGEFIRPRHLSVSRNGDLAVTDGATGRVTVFDSSGVVLTTLQLDFRPQGTHAYGDKLAVTRLGMSVGDVAWEVTDAGELGTPILSVTESEAEIGRFGDPGAFGSTASGLGFASPKVGLWRIAEDGAVVSGGTELFPGLAGRSELMEGGIEYRTVPVAARGFGQRRNGDVVVFYRVMTDPDEQLELPARGLWVATFAPDGGFRGSRLLFPDSEEARGPTLGPDDHLYVQTTVPFPRVIKYEMKILP